MWGNHLWSKKTKDKTAAKAASGLSQRTHHQCLSMRNYTWTFALGLLVSHRTSIILVASPKDWPFKQKQFQESSAHKRLSHTAQRTS